MPKIQLKIVGALAALVVLVVGLSAVFAEVRLRERKIDELVEMLEVRTRLVASMVPKLELGSTPSPALAEFAKETARIAAARVTLIAPDGVVLADSALSLDEVMVVAPHHDRPEVIDAVAGGYGHAMRRSGTLKRPLLYTALTVKEVPSIEGRPMIVRLAIDLDQVDAAIADLRLDLLRACLVGLVAALGLSVVLARFTLRPIQELSAAVADIAEGNLDRRLHWDGSLDERTEIASAINRMARQMRDRVNQATRERDQLEAVLSAMTEGVLVLDAEHRVLLANPRLREMFHIWGQVEGRLAAEVVRSSEVNSALDDASESDDLIAREVEVLVPRERTVMVHAGRFPKEGERLGTVAVLHDVTELRRVDRVRSDFIANASHELRTPLTAIRGFADTLLRSDLDKDSIAPYLEIIGRNSQRMADLVDDLLQLSRIESGRAVLEETELDLVGLCDQALKELAPRLEKAKLTAEFHCDADEVVCWSDRRALEQVITNLLTNAVRYTNAGGRIDLELEDSEERIEIRVRDTGIGIPEASLDRIFERFYRVDAARSRVIGSTGLGLSIVKHLLRSLGGEVSVQSRVGEGSTFVVRLPHSRRKRENPTLFDHPPSRGPADEPEAVPGA